MKTIKNILCTILVSILIPCTCLGAGNGRNGRRGNGQEQNSPHQTRQAVNTKARANRAQNLPTGNPANLIPQNANPFPIPPNIPLNTNTITLSTRKEVTEHLLPIPTSKRVVLVVDLHDNKKGEVTDESGHVTRYKIKSVRGGNSSTAAINQLYDTINKGELEEIYKKRRMDQNTVQPGNRGTQVGQTQQIPGQNPEPEQPTTRNNSGSGLEPGQQEGTTEQQQPVLQQEVNQRSNEQVGGQNNNDNQQQQQENPQKNQETPVDPQGNQQQPRDSQGDQQQQQQQQPINLQNNQQKQQRPTNQKGKKPANPKQKKQKQTKQNKQNKPTGQQGVHPWVQQAQQLAANMQQNRAPLAAPNNLPGVYRNDVFEQTNILRQNAHVVHELMKDSAQRGVNLKAGYLKHKQSVARGLGYDADTFLLAGTLSSGPVNVWGDQTCTFALTAAYTDTSADYKGKYIKSKKEKNCSKEKTFFFGPYVAYNLDRLNINASFLYGHTKYETSRALPKDVALTTWSRKNNVSYNGDSMHGNVTLSYTWTFANFHVQPQLGVQYDHVVQKSHNLKIDNNTMAIKKQKLDFVSPFAGVRVSANVNLSGGKQSLVPYVFVGVSRDVHRHASVANKNVLNGNPVTTIVYPGSRDMLITAAGVQWKSDWPVTLDLEYRGVFSGHRRSHEVLGGLGYSF